jgi:hypothetical protein
VSIRAVHRRRFHDHGRIVGLATDCERHHVLGWRRVRRRPRRQHDAGPGKTPQAHTLDLDDAGHIVGMDY